MFSCQALAHAERRSSDCWRSPQLETSTLKDEYSLTSSAKSLSLAWPIQADETSFIKIKNKTGPRTEPCGTPLVTLATLEKQLSITTHCSLLCINADIKVNSLPVMP